MMPPRPLGEPNLRARVLAVQSLLTDAVSLRILGIEQSHQMELYLFALAGTSFTRRQVDIATSIQALDQAVHHLEEYIVSNGKAKNEINIVHDLLKSRMEQGQTSLNLGGHTVMHKQADNLSTQRNKPLANDEAGVIRPRSQIRNSSGEYSDNRNLQTAADACNDEARRQERRMYFLLFLSFVLVIAVASVTLGIGIDFPTFQWQSWAVLFVVLTLALALAWEASRIRKSSDELRRLGRQIDALPAYLEPLPEAAQSLMRAVMIQRIFPRILDDSDPLRETEWFPSTDTLLAAIDPSVLKKIDEMLSSEEGTLDDS